MTQVHQPPEPGPKQSRASVRLPRSTRSAIYLIGSGTWITGLSWLLLDKFVIHNGPFGPEKSPLEAWSLKLHGALAMGAVFLFGFLWAIHVRAAWPTGRRRLSGVALTGWIILLVVSGYLLYYVANEDARAAISIAHWVSGLALPLLYWFHRWKRRALRRSIGKDPRPSA